MIRVPLAYSGAWHDAEGYHRMGGGVPQGGG